MAGYSTNLGRYLCESSLDGLETLEDNSIDLIITSPPFSNQRKKKYDNFNEIPQDAQIYFLGLKFYICLLICFF